MLNANSDGRGGRVIRWQYRLKLHIENSSRDRVVRYSDLLNFGSQLSPRHEGSASPQLFLAIYKASERLPAAKIDQRKWRAEAINENGVPHEEFPETWSHKPFERSQSDVLSLR